MKIVTGIRTPSKDAFNCEWFYFGKIYTNSLDEIKGSVFVQDPTHVGTKFMNRFTKHSSILPFGDKVISNAHLKLLIQTVSKETFSQ